MSGLVFDVGATIAHLKQLLADRYPRAGSELPLLKEILQNADDAGASELHLVVLETGVAGAANPLLAGPALVCINDGRFTPKDEDALRTFGNTSKAGEDAAIGRFGVGQKSVFHLAEAYFYLGRSSPDDPVRGDVIDPWADPTKGDRYFEEWNEFGEQDRLLAQRAVARWLSGSSWFVLYLPLRTRAHERGPGGVIAQHFPTVAQLASDLADLTQLGCLIPQLLQLRKVATWRHRSPSDEPACLGSAQWRPEGKGLSRPGTNASFRRQCRGVVDVERPGSGTTKIEAYGSECCVPDRDLVELRDRPEWPTRASVSPDGTLENDREKAIPHGAATFLRVNDGGGDLRISWAAFLPLGNSPEVVRRAELTPGWRLVLHGYFFPDSGRQGVAGGVNTNPVADDRHGSEELKFRWNSLLRQRATLPSLVPALEAAVRARPGDEGERLASALAQSDVWKEFRGDATAGGTLAWGPGWTESGAVESRAHAVGPSWRLLRIPRAVNPHDELATLLRCYSVVERNGSAAVVWEDGPRLGARGEFDAWDSPCAKAVFEEIRAQVLESSEALRYLLQWVRAEGDSGPGIREQLPGLLRRCFGASVLTLGANVEHWRALAAHCPDGAVIWSSTPVSLLRELSSLPTGVLLLPEKLRSGAHARSEPTLSIADARTLLRALAGKLEDDDSGDVEKLIAELVAMIGPRAVLEDPELRDLRIVRVWSARAGRHVCIKPVRLRELVVEGAAFSKEGVARANDFARRVAAAVVSATDVVVVDDPSMAEAMQVGPFNERTLKTLLRRPSTELGGVPERNALLSWILGTARGAFGGLVDLETVRRDPELAPTLRYLVHADRDHLHDQARLLFESERGDELAHSVLRATGDSWRVVPWAVAQNFNPAWMTSLGIVPIEPFVLIAELDALPREKLDLLRSSLEPAHRAALRVLLAHERASALFASLPIHDTVGGRIVSGETHGVFLVGEWPVPGSMRDSVELVPPSSDPMERALQLETFHRWTAETQLFRALEDDRPSRLAPEILDAFARSDVTAPEKLELVRVKKWLTTRNGLAASPGEVLYLPEPVDRSLRDLLGEERARAFLSPSDLASEVRRHDAFQLVLEQVALSGRDAFQAAALQLEDASREGDNPFWILASRSREEDEDFLLRGVGVGALASDPAWRVVRALHQEYAGAFLDVGCDLLNSFRLRPSASRVVQLLLRFREERGFRAAEETSHSRAMFEAYLRHAALRSDFVEAILPRIELLNANGTWKPAAELAWIDALNVQPRFQVIERFRTILAEARFARPAFAPGLEAGQSEQPASADEAHAAEVLAAYFAPWTGFISSEPIGYFLACLGNGPGGSIARLAERFLKSARSADGARDVVFKELGAFPVGAEQGFCARARWSFRVVADGDEVEVVSLAGTPLVATVAGGTPSGVFAGQVPHWRESRPETIRLATIDPSSVSGPELQKLLGASLRQFLLASLGFPLDENRLADFWNQFGSGGKAQVAAVRSLILERLPVYIEELVGARDPVFRGACQELERSEQRFREVSATRGMPEDTVAKTAAARDAALGRLRTLVEEDPAARARLLVAVRKKLTTYQYSPAQVLFELFQNADDATRDLEDLHDAGKTSPHLVARTFDVTVDSNPVRVRIQHWGRPVNRGEMSARDPQATDRSYELDLKNMLVLHLSDKDDRSTGRFGLGFKSVHLVTDRPRVRSADLSFEVLGGLIPQHVPIGGVPDSSTTIELPLERPGELATVVTRFRHCAGLLAVFGRAIRRISYTDRDVRREVGWAPTRLEDAAGIEIGELAELDPAPALEPARALVLRGVDPTTALAISFRLGTRGLERMVGLPEVWCTTPTDESWGLGFCLNGAFELDIGRGRLAYSSENRRLFTAAGRLLADRLAAVASALDQRFERTVRALGIEVGGRDPDLVRRDFWASAFDLLTAEKWERRDANVVELIGALHASGVGLSSLVSSHRVLPTGLPGEHDLLTTAGAVRWVLDDTASYPEVLRALLRLGTWASPAPGTVVAAEVRTRLERVRSTALRSASALSFGQILCDALPDRTTLTPELARECMVLRDSVKEAAGPVSSAFETLQARLGRALFPSRGGKARAPNELLVGRSGEPIELPDDSRSVHDLKDELARGAFAPDDFVLQAEFAADPQALALFLFARQRLVKGGSEQAARWAIDAPQGIRPAVLAYLAHGSLRGEVLAEIEHRGGLPWCQQEDDLMRFAEALGPRELDVLRIHLLGYATSPIADPDSLEEDGELVDPLDPQPPVPERQPEQLLHRIADWWKRRGAHWTALYDKAAYGALGGAAALSQQLRGGERDAWLALLALAACQRFGRQVEQQHSGFVRELREKGHPRWWSVLAAPPGNGSAAKWIGILDQWLAGRTDEDQYRLWLGLYPTLYQLHRYGDTYRELLARAPDHDAASFSLQQLLAPRANPQLTGAGSSFDAPPLAPALGIGASWALRELVRLKVIEPAAHVARYCYVPRLKTRELLRRLGAPDMDGGFAGDHGERSKRMFDFVASHLGSAGAGFGGAFDYPIYLYATQLEVQKECAE